MNLYLLQQEENRGFDTYDALVVAAESEDDAIRIYPNYDKDVNYGGGLGKAIF